MVASITHPRCILNHGKISNGMYNCDRYECGKDGSGWYAGFQYKPCCDCGQDKCWNGKKCVER